MPREVLTIQVGQCGNQIGCRFWDLVLREHAHVSKTSVFDSALSSFFRNVDTRYSDPLDISVGDGRNPIRTLKARSILVDMEEGVVNSLLSGPLADIFDARQRITDVSGSGNNWAHGHHLYGPMYRDSIEEKVRQGVEHCESLQCFLLLHSLGGGTGSGLGTFILQSLEDLYPEVFRFVSCVCPSKDDDVITSPYNTTLALRALIDSAHCVLPVSNDALVSVCNNITAHDAGRDVRSSLIDLPQDERKRRSFVGGVGSSAASTPTRPPSAKLVTPLLRGREIPRGADGKPRQRRITHSAPPGRQAEPPQADDRPAHDRPTSRARAQPQGAFVDPGAEKPFDRMNSLVAHLLNNLTSSMRFEGSLNLDLNEITMNLVPFPRMHFLLSSMSPLYCGKDPRLVSRGFNQMFSDVLSHGHQLMNVDPRGSTYMAMAFLVRGSASIADVHRNVAKVRKNIRMLPFNDDAFKLGLCAVPPRGLPYSVLGLANSCAAHHMFSQTLRDFGRLYSRKAHVHHYTQYMEQQHFNDAFDAVNSLMKDYIHLEMVQEAPAVSSINPTPPVGPASLLFTPSAWVSLSSVRQREDLYNLQNFSPKPLL